MIANDLAQPANRQRLVDRSSVAIWNKVLDAHCFECSAVIDMAKPLAADMIKNDRVPGRLAFLPAKATWLEWMEPSGRIAVLLQEAADSRFASVDFFVSARESGPRHKKGGVIRLEDVAMITGESIDGLAPHQNPLFRPMSDALIYAFLSIINTPRIIDRRQHMPHAGLQRKLAKAHGGVGKYPLHAWNEVVLEVTPPRVDDGEPHEARLTGGKALHFCRAHLRIRLGRLELVSAHWRGDPALGMKQSRYRVEGPRA